MNFAEHHAAFEDRLLNQHFEDQEAEDRVQEIIADRLDEIILSTKIEELILDLCDKVAQGHNTDDDLKRLKQAIEEKAKEMAEEELDQ